ncbi:MAG: hypothetical protein KF718_12170 [Polyangiaceae bacterium]|nr:hypothetical protein [Polyangiaceae bacterium]
MSVMGPRFGSLLMMGAALLAGMSARADVAPPPPDGCNKLGEDCNNAPPDNKSAGTCVDFKCVAKAPSSSDDDDGCAVSASGAAASTSAAWAALGALAWTAARRRRPRAK